jgi:hypothetical protein
MSYQAARVIVASGLALWAATVQAQIVVTPLFPGITHIKRTEEYPPFQCPGLLPGERNEQRADRPE